MIRTLAITLSTIIVVTGAIGYYLFNKSTPSKRILQRFSSSKIDSTCKDSPKLYSYTKCFQRNLSKVYEVARPFDILSIRDKITEIFKIDSDKNKSNNDFYKVIDEYAYSWSISIDHLRNFRIHRSELSYFQILFRPMIDKKIIEKMKNIVIYLNESKDSFPDEESKNQLDTKIEKINIFTGVGKV